MGSAGACVDLLSEHGMRSSYDAVFFLQGYIGNQGLFAPTSGRFYNGQRGALRGRRGGQFWLRHWDTPDRLCWFSADGNGAAWYVYAPLPDTSTTGLQPAVFLVVACVASGEGRDGGR